MVRKSRKWPKLQITGSWLNALLLLPLQALIELHGVKIHLLKIRTDSRWCFVVSCFAVVVVAVVVVVVVVVVVIVVDVFVVVLLSDWLIKTPDEYRPLPLSINSLSTSTQDLKKELTAVSKVGNLVLEFVKTKVCMTKHWGLPLRNSKSRDLWRTVTLSGHLKAGSPLIWIFGCFLLFLSN